MPKWALVVVIAAVVLSRISWIRDTWRRFRWTPAEFLQSVRKAR